MDQDPSRPGLEAVRIPQRGELPPDGDERALQGVLGQVVVAQDPGGDGEHPVAGQVDKRRECLPITSLRADDEIAHQRVPSA
jgi:hypothetical protein